MSVKVYESGAWRDINSAKVYENGAWRDINSAKVYENGAWREVYPNLPALSYGKFVTYRGKIIDNSIATAYNSCSLKTDYIRVTGSNTYSGLNLITNDKYTIVYRGPAGVGYPYFYWYYPNGSSIGSGSTIIPTANKIMVNGASVYYKVFSPGTYAWINVVGKLSTSSSDYIDIYAVIQADTWSGTSPWDGTVV